MTDVVKRVNYFNGEFLRADDFNDEQGYHVRNQRDHARLLHTPGVAEGLEIPDPTIPGTTAVTVNAGVAFDALGQRIVLADNYPLELKDAPAGQDVYVTIAYSESQTDSKDDTGVTGNTRWTEAALIETAGTAPSDSGQKLVLARISRTGNAISSIDRSARRVAGTKGGDLAVRSLTLTSESLSQTGWVSAALDASGRAALGGSLHVTGSLVVDGTIQGNIAVNTVTTGDLVDNAVSSVKLAEADGTSGQDPNTGAGVKTAHIQDGAITNSKLANNSVNAAKVVAASLGAAQLSDGAVTNTKLADNAVTITKIVDGNVGATKLADNAVTTTKLADASVTATKIVDGNVGTIKLADGAVTLTKLASTAQPVISVGGVSNPGGGIGLTRDAASAITIVSDNIGKNITIGETHSTLTSNPHQTTAAQIDGGSNLIVTQINNGTGTINAARVSPEKLNGRSIFGLANLTPSGSTVPLTTTRDLRNKLITVRGWASTATDATPLLLSSAQAITWNPANFGALEAWAYCRAGAASGTTTLLFAFTDASNALNKVNFFLDFLTPGLNLRMTTTTSFTIGYVFQFTWQE